MNRMSEGFAKWPHAKWVETFADTSKWDFVNPEDKKKCVWWNPLDWIPKYFKAI